FLRHGSVVRDWAWLVSALVGAEASLRDYKVAQIVAETPPKVSRHAPSQALKQARPSRHQIAVICSIIKNRMELAEE
ncbi:MAG TPA: hypothetical protein VLC91_08760, partial [Spongiibacteraceae bacterium]|nr:hypothetical protein [Spongiibacteraceae bacterium]